jgi:hypothetical protein
MKQKLGSELARVLVKRIQKVLEEARYYPARAIDTEATAREVVRPYLEKGEQ